MLRPRLLLTGTTGYIGGRLRKVLEHTAYPLRCLARRPQFLQARAAPTTEIVSGDVLDRASLDQAMHGVHTAYYLIHSMNSIASFEAADRQAAHNFAEAATQAGVQRLISLGTLGDEQSRLSPHLRSRQEVGEILRHAAVPVIELRCAVSASCSYAFGMVLSPAGGALAKMLFPFKMGAGGMIGTGHSP